MARKKIVVLLGRNVLQMTEDDRVLAEFNCVHGNNQSTPIGTHRVLLKERDKVSIKYKAPMPFSLKFTSDYCAVHGTTLADARSYAQWIGFEVGSHGCIGLSVANAERVFNWAEVGTPVQIRPD